MSNWGNENASQRKTYVGVVFDRGEKLVKKEILSNLQKKWADLHTQGYIHIHDLDAYGLTYNCLTFNLLNKFPYDDFLGLSYFQKIIKLFDFYKDLLAKVGNEQSGGMAFANFDSDTAFILQKLGIELNKLNAELIRDEIGSLIAWCNNSHERMGEVSYYVTLNIGLADNKYAQTICDYILSEFASTPSTVFKPNIVFKVKSGVNSQPQDKNYYLLQKACACTTKKMIPTYMLCDCESDKAFNPKNLAVMGCRSRVVADLFGEATTIGRGNIDNITINLPRIAFESNGSIENFKKKWLMVASSVKDILIDRYNKLLQQSKTDFPTNLKYDLWRTDFSSAITLEDIFKHGTLSIGFIGLSETVEILSGDKYYKTEQGYDIAKNIVQFMRTYVDELRQKYNMNFSLLATSGEYISGRFPSIDKMLYCHQILEKEFYTNSFHVEVDSGLTVFEKLKTEGYFHSLCNGGCISYIELKSAPIGNVEAIIELIEYAEKCGVHYLGVNFPLDICNECGAQGVFDKCIKCGSAKITRIRRVSGYLEILDYFTAGKKAEVKNRRKN